MKMYNITQKDLNQGLGRMTKDGFSIKSILCTSALSDYFGFERYPFPVSQIIKGAYKGNNFELITYETDLEEEPIHAMGIIIEVENASDVLKKLIEQHKSTVTSLMNEAADENTDIKFIASKVLEKLYFEGVVNGS